MERNHMSKKTITVERISITTIRTRNGNSKFYCENCHRSIEAGEIYLAPPQPHETIDVVAAVSDSSNNNEIREK
jgi:hypothetical protein